MSSHLHLGQAVCSLGFFYDATAPSGLCRLVVDVSWSHFLDTPHSVGLLWTRGRPVAETSTWQHTTFTRDRHPCCRRDSNPHPEQASGRRPTPSTARPLGSAFLRVIRTKFYMHFSSHAIFVCSVHLVLLYLLIVIRVWNYEDVRCTIFFPFFRYFYPPNSRYLPQCLALKHPYSVPFLSWGPTL